MLGPKTISLASPALRKSASAWRPCSTSSSEARLVGKAPPRLALLALRCSVIRSRTRCGTWVPPGLSKNAAPEAKAGNWGRIRVTSRDMVHLRSATDHGRWTMDRGRPPSIVHRLPSVVCRPRSAVDHALRVGQIQRGVDVEEAEPVWVEASQFLFLYGKHADAREEADHALLPALERVLNGGEATASVDRVQRLELSCAARDDDFRLGRQGK